LRIDHPSLKEGEKKKNPAGKALRIIYLSLYLQSGLFENIFNIDVRG
jgi:hypothetical protein